MEEEEAGLIQYPTFVKDVNEVIKVASNVLDLCITEARIGQLQVHLADNNRASAYTKTPIPAEKITPPTFPLLSEAFYIRPLIQKAFTSMVLEKRLLPTLKLLHKEVGNASLTMPCMKELGYKWQKLPNNNHAFIVENPEFIRVKYRYLRKIQQCRTEKRDVIYLTRITGHSINVRQPQLFQKHRNLLLEQNLVIYVAFSSQNGLLDETVGSLSDGPEGSEGFQEWILKQIVPIVPKKSILVIPKLVSLEKSSKEKAGIINASCSKKDIMTCLEKNNILFDKFMHKAQLYDLMTKHEFNKHPKGQIEIQMEAKGVSFLFRPVWMTDFCYSYELFNSISNINEKLVELVTSDKVSVAGYFFSNILSGLSHSYLKMIEEKLAIKEEECLKDDAMVEDIIDQVLAMAKEEEILDTDATFNELDLYESPSEE